MKMHKPAAPHRPASGFTLVELMLAVAILGILASLAAPSFTDLIESQRAKSAATDIYVALARARSEAVKRNTSVTLSPKSANWANGWQIPDPVSGTIIEDHDAISNLTVTGPTSVIYQSSGRVSGTTAPSFVITGAASTSARCVAVDLSGRPSVKAGTSC